MTRPCFIQGHGGRLVGQAVHYVENCGDEPLRYLEVFRSSYFADVSANQWMALTPPELVKAHLDLDARAVAALRKDKAILAK
jgi:oxalate decarboxylase